MKLHSETSGQRRRIFSGLRGRRRVPVDGQAGVERAWDARPVRGGTAEAASDPRVPIGGGAHATRSTEARRARRLPGAGAPRGLRRVVCVLANTRRRGACARPDASRQTVRTQQAQQGRVDDGNGVRGPAHIALEGARTAFANALVVISLPRPR